MKPALVIGLFLQARFALPVWTEPGSQEVFVSIGPLCVWLPSLSQYSLNTDNSKEDEEYIKCHSLAKKKYTECIDSHCQCYYIHVVSRQCIKLCTTYVCLSIETKRASLTHSASRNLI